jgi:NAD(P)-dependent dehydrogenase (short-subunit alcohol dehydrogenase family)
MRRPKDVDGRDTPGHDSGNDESLATSVGRTRQAATLLDTSDDEFDRVVGENLRGVWHGLKTGLRPMPAAGSGAYSASKHAVSGPTECHARLCRLACTGGGVLENRWFWGRKLDRGNHG